MAKNSRTFPRDQFKGPKGDRGPVGPRGPQGPAGTGGGSGDDGSTWYDGADAPSSLLGEDGDYYLRTSNGDVYTKAGGVWTVTGNIKGPAGDDGADGSDGADGAPGSVWRDGAGVPSNSLGVDGDYYLRTSNGDVYWKDAGAYSVVGNIKGPQGDPGADGADGADGAGVDPYVLPTTGSFAWVNQGGATITDQANVYSLLSAPTAATRNIRARTKAAPSTPYSITALMIVEASAAGSFPDGGLLWRDSSSGKMIRFALVAQGGGQPVLFLSKEDSATAFNSSYALDWVECYRLIAGMFAGFLPVWLRIADDGANRICSVSTDGVNFIVVHTVGRTDFMTPDEIGFGIQVATGGSALRIISWIEA